MKDLTKTKRYRNKKYLAAARGQSCTFRYQECNYDNKTTIACHNSGGGMAGKVGDDDIAFGCYDCHRIADQRDLKHDEIGKYTLEYRQGKFVDARYLTHVKLHEMGLMEKSDIGVVK